jgi:hypothetical protein
MEWNEKYSMEYKQHGMGYCGIYYSCMIYCSCMLILMYPLRTVAYLTG